MWFSHHCYSLWKLFYRCNDLINYYFLLKIPRRGLRWCLTTCNSFRNKVVSKVACIKARVDCKQEIQVNEFNQAKRRRKRCSLVLGALHFFILPLLPLLNRSWLRLVSIGVGADKFLAVRKILARNSPNFPEKFSGNFWCEYFLPHRSCLGWPPRKGLHVILPMLGAIFIRIFR